MTDLTNLTLNHEHSGGYTLTLSTNRGSVKVSLTPEEAEDILRLQVDTYGYDYVEGRVRPILPALHLLEEP